LSAHTADKWHRSRRNPRVAGAAATPTLEATQASAEVVGAMPRRAAASAWTPTLEAADPVGAMPRRAATSA